MTPGLRPAVFVDRDGTLIAERDYLADPAGVRFVPGAVPALAALRAAGFALVVVTNQSGIARGLYRLTDYRAVARRMDDILAEAGVPVDGTYFCPHHPDYTGPCVCRKPAVGMYVAAARDHALDLRASWYVGDKLSDVLPALELGGQGILVRSGYGREVEASVPRGVSVAEDLPAAAALIVASAGGLRRALTAQTGPG